MLKILIQPNPVTSERHILNVPTGSSLEEIYKYTNIRVPIESCIIAVNDMVCTDYQHCPTEEDLITIKALPAGSEEAQSSLGVIGQGVSWAVAGAYLFGPFGLLLFFPGLIFGALTQIRPDNTKQTYSFEGKKNENEQYQIVPVLYGTTKYAPSFGASDFTTTVITGSSPDTSDVYLHQLYIIGYKPTKIDTIYIGDNPIVTRKHVTTDTLTISSANKTITSSAGFLSGGSRIFTEGSRIILHAGANYDEYIVTEVTSDTVIKCNDAEFSDEEAVIEYSYLVADNPLYDIDFQIVDDGDFTATNYPYQIIESNIGKNCAYNTPQYYTTPAEINKLEIEVGFLSGLAKVKSNNSLTSLKVQFKVEIRKFDAPEWITSITYTSEASQREPYRITKTYNLPDRGQYVVRVTRLTPDSEDTKYLDVLTFINAKTEKVDTDNDRIPPIAPDTAANLVCLVLKVKASEQISNTINDLNVVATRWVNEYTGTDVANDDQEEWTKVKETHNPASMFVDVLRNTFLAQHPADDIMINWPAVQAWHVWCDANNYTCNGILLNETTVQEELTKIVATGRSDFCLIDGKYTVNQLIAKNTAVQMFTSRNIIQDTFSVSRNFEGIPDGASVQFVNAEVGYILDELQINEEYDTNIALSFEYVDNYKQAQELGQFLLNSAASQILLYTFGAALDALIATRGDKIILQHDAALLSISSGRIVSVAKNSSNQITSITTDEAFPYETGETYGITIRTDDAIYGPYELVSKSTGDYTTHNLPLQAYVVNDYVVAGDLCVFGLFSTVMAECLINDIQYDNHGHATIQAVQYDSGVYDLSGIPEWKTNITLSGVRSGVSVSPPFQELTKDLQSKSSHPAMRVFQETPVPSYNIGDLWMDGAYTYDCVIEKEPGASYERADWRLCSTSTFDVLNKDTFNIPNPKQRWQQIPGDGVPYNLLTTTAFTASADSDPVSKDNILALDGVAWEPPSAIATITVAATGASHVHTVGTFDSAYIVGRYANSGYMGEAYTNLLADPKNPVTQDIDLDAGHVVVQCYRGTITCTEGVAEYGVPLEFDLASDETVTFTISADCWYGSVTQTDFIPPYADGIFSAVYDTLSITSSPLSLRIKIVNIPSTDTYSICHIHGDADNYIKIYLYDEQMVMEIASVGETITEYIAVSSGIYDIELDWSDAVTINIESVPYVFTEVGYVYGFSTHAYGFNSSMYGYGGSTIAFAVSLDTADIGEGFNNTVLEVEYE